MILDNLLIRGQAGKKQILTSDDHITAIREKEGEPAVKTEKETIHFDDAIALPGLINSHDHLDFNLFPQLGNRQYANYREWGRDIHDGNKNSIDAVLKIPESLRVEWGKYKNLLNGFTTVVNHGNKIPDSDELISVFQNCYSLHSIAFEKNWKTILNNPLKTGKPFVMHIGEGTDDMTKNEINTVIKANWFRKKIIAVHAVQIDRQQAAAFAGLVWCPASNYFLLGAMADVKNVKDILPVVFGTDSALSASWNSWEHFRQGLAGVAITEDELIAMLTSIPAALWGLNDRGILAAGKRADIIVLKNKPEIASVNPEDVLLVVHKGQVRLYDDSIASQLSWLAGKPFSRIKIKDSLKFIQGDLPDLINQIRLLRPEQEFPAGV